MELLVLLFALISGIFCGTFWIISIYREANAVVSGKKVSLWMTGIVRLALMAGFFSLWAVLGDFPPLATSFAGFLVAKVVGTMILKKRNG